MFEPAINKYISDSHESFFVVSWSNGLQVVFDDLSPDERNKKFGEFKQREILGRLLFTVKYLCSTFLKGKPTTADIISNLEKQVKNRLGDDASTSILKQNDTTTGLKLTLNIDTTKEEAADICGSVGGSLLLNSMFSKYIIPGTVCC